MLASDRVKAEDVEREEIRGILQGTVCTAILHFLNQSFLDKSSGIVTPCLDQMETLLSLDGRSPPIWPIWQAML